MITTTQLLAKVKRERQENPPVMPSAEALMEKAKKALRRKQKNGPRLLLEAVNYRIHELEPDCSDYWAAAQRIAKTRNKGAIEGGYRGLMIMKAAADRNGSYYKEDAELLYETAEIVLHMLGPEQD